jgi:hypothetical protein
VIERLLPFKQTMTKRYKANITAGALLVPETKKICRLLLQRSTSINWKKVIEQENLLQKRSLNSSKRIANLIRARLRLVGPELWLLVRDGSYTTATQATFAAAIKHSRLLGDYLDIVVRDHFERLEDYLGKNAWEEYLQGCRQRDPEMQKISESTSAKLRGNIHKILKEVGYLKDTKTRRLEKIEIEPQVLEYLRQQKEDYVLQCIQL